MIKILIYIFVTLFSMRLAISDEIRYLVRSPRALLLGDAFTAIADDEYTLFIIQQHLVLIRGIGITLANIDSSFPNLLKPNYVKKLTASLGTDLSAISSNYMGLPQYSPWNDSNRKDE